jgi:hypothetical protein
MEWYPLERGAVRRRRWPWAFLAGAVALAALVTAALFLRSDPSPIAEAPASPPPAVAAEQTPAQALDAFPDVVDHRGAAEEIAQIAAQVADIRMLDLRETIDATFLPTAELVELLTELTAEEEGAARPLESRARLLAALHMLPADADLAAVLRIVHDESVVGLYVPSEQRLYVAQEEAGSTPRSRWTSAHEIVHALQDQAFDLGPLLEHPEGALDAELAALAVLEGDAVVTQELWSRRFQTEIERSQLGDGLAPAGIPVPGRLPRYLTARFAFPYEAGGDFVVALMEHGGFEAVNAALANPPRTTSEILHPDRYLAGMVPVDVEVQADPGPGWVPSRTDEMGEFDVRAMLDQLGTARAAQLAAGWAGGTARSWERNGHTAVALAIAFETDESAAALCAALPGWWQAATGASPQGAGAVAGPGGSLSFACDGQTVRIGVAPDPTVAQTLSR